VVLLPALPNDDCPLSGHGRSIQMMKKDSKILSVISSFLIALFCLSAAIAVPILCRGWYYHEVEALHLSEQTGFSNETIHGAFNAVMDFLVKGSAFSTGALKWSESGRSHFEDCKGLFQLDFLLLGATALALLVLAFLRRKIAPRLFFNRTPAFWAFLGTLAGVLVFGMWALVDFNSLFTTFHILFFPGKTNWVFDSHADQIILLLPEVFWAHTAALVAGLTLGGEALAALVGEIWNRAHSPKNIYEKAQQM